jgi:integrase
MEATFCLSAVRKLIRDARRYGIRGPEQAAQMADIPNIRQQGTRLSNWLTRDQAKELLAVSDRTTLKGKRDAAILALLVGCALRRAELAELHIEDIHKREDHWVIAGLTGKGGRIRTVALPLWIKRLIDAWMAEAGHSAGREASQQKRARCGEELSDWAVRSAVESSAKAIGIERFGAHDLRRTGAKLRRKNGGNLEQIKFLLSHASIQTTERYLCSEQEIAVAVNDNLGL